MSLLSKKNYTIGALALCIGGFSVAAYANKIEGETPFILLGSEDSGTSKEVGVGDIILRSRLVYGLMAVADEDIVGRDGKVVGPKSKVLLRKGEQMFGVNSSNGQITYCSLKNKDPGALEGVFVINRDKHACFIDADRDGKFESSYDLRTKWTTNIPIYYDVEDIGNSLDKKIGYSPIDPKTSSLPIYFEAYVSSINKKGTKASIGYRMMSSRGGERLARYDDILANSENGIETFNDAVFSVSIVDSTKLRVNIKNGFREGPFLTGRRRVFFY